MKKIAIWMIALILSLTVLPCYATDDGVIVLPSMPLSSTSDATASDGTELGEDLLDQDTADVPSDTTEDVQESVTVADVLIDEDGNVTLVMSDGTTVNVGTASTEESLEDTPEASNKFMFDPSNFVGNLSYMGVGMVGIFIVIGIIVLATVVLNKIFSDKPKKSE